MRNVLGLNKTNKGNILPDTNVIFNVAAPFSDGISYDPMTGEAVITNPGQYFISWWVATETTLTGCMQFAVKLSQGEPIVGCSSAKRGQIAGFGIIDVTDPDGVTLSLSNMGAYPVVLSKTSPMTSSLTVVRIPEDSILPTFAVSETETLEPGESAAADIQEDADNPNKWLFSFGIPKGETGNPGVSPHIDTEKGNWFIGSTDTGVPAQGPKGDPGPVGMPEYYNFKLTSANNIGNPVSFIVGNVRFAFSYYNTTMYQLRYYPAQPGTNVLCDYRRFAYFDSTPQGGIQNGNTLTEAGWIVDDTILSMSNEWQSTFLRQQNPDGTWSLCEYKLFGSINMARITLWINWIYTDLAVPEW